MSITPQIKFSKFDLPKKGLVVTFTENDLDMSETTAELDKLSDGQIKRAAEYSKFTGKKKSSLDILAPTNLGLGRIILFGLGDPKKLKEEDWVNLGGTIRAKLTGRDATEATIVLQKSGKGQLDPDVAANVAFGLLLRGYKFEKYKSKKADDKEENDDDSKELTRVTIQCDEPAKSRNCFDALNAVAEGIAVARDLVNEPANKLGPEEFAEKAKELEKLGVEVEILDEKEMSKLGMGALLGVGQGSAKPSYLVVMQWNGSRSKKAKPLAFIGKGVTFDTGGISIKPSQGMEDMKGDMGGAACVTGLMHALASRKAKVNVVGVIGLTENMVSSHAQRPGDVVTAMSGQTIEVINTDAEGRLVLADALWYTQDRFKPKFMINLATLTGAILVALGKEYAGMFSNSDELCKELSEAGLATGEKVWRLPLGKAYDKTIDSKVADIKNLGDRYAGSITAAQFLQRFVNDVPWVHLDIAGTAMSSPQNDINRSWGSGYGVRLLNRLIADHYEK